jgi:amino acid transporter
MALHPSTELRRSTLSLGAFEATTLYGEEARNPKRNIPIATYAALLRIGGFYSLSTWCLVVGQRQ